MEKDENEKPETCRCGYPPEECRCEELAYGTDCRTGGCE